MFYLLAGELLILYLYIKMEALAFNCDTNQYVIQAIRYV